MAVDDDPFGILLSVAHCGEPVVIEIIGSDKVVRSIVKHLGCLPGIMFIGAEQREDNRYKLGSTRKFIARAVIPLDALGE